MRDLGDRLRVTTVVAVYNRPLTGTVDGISTRTARQAKQVLRNTV